MIKLGYPVRNNLYMGLGATSQDHIYDEVYNKLNVSISLGKTEIKNYLLIKIRFM